MKYWKTFLIAFFFIAVSCLASWLLLNSPVEILIDCHIRKPVDLKVYPSRPMDRSIGEEAYVCHLEPAAGNAVSRLRAAFPLSCFRKIRIEVPPETEVELSRMEYKLFGSMRCTVPMYFVAKSSFRNLNIIPFQGSDGSQVEMVWILTKKLPGRLDIRVVNDLPRFLAFLFGMLAAALILVVISKLINAIRFGHNTEKLLLSSFLILIFAGMVFQIIVPSGNPVCRKPELNLLSITDYPEQFTSWYQNNLPFRDDFISIYHKFCSLMNISPVDKVIIGQYDWLFLHHSNDHDNAYENYMGTNLFTQEELHSTLEKMKVVQARLKKMNIRFAIFIAPGKLSVYNDQLRPEWRRKDPGGMTRSVQIYDYIRKNSDIPVEYPLKELIAARKTIPQPLYYKSDTHWNYLGGYVAARSMMKLIDPVAAGKMPDLTTLKLTVGPHASGDLFRMLNVPPRDDQDYWTIRNPDLKYEKYLSAGDAGCYSFDGQNQRGKRVFFIRDSFFFGMVPYLACHLSYFTCYWDFSLNMSVIEMERPDIVIIEIVERFLDSLLHFPEVSWQMKHGGRQM